MGQQLLLLNTPTPPQPAVLLGYLPEASPGWGKLPIVLEISKRDRNKRSNYPHPRPNRGRSAEPQCCWTEPQGNLLLPGPLPTRPLSAFNTRRQPQATESDRDPFGMMSERATAGIKMRPSHHQKSNAVRLSSGSATLPLPLISNRKTSMNPPEIRQW